MRILKTMAVAAAAALWLGGPVSADETNKLTYLTFSKPVELPGLTLEAGRYRFEVADPQETGRVIKVPIADGKPAVAILLSIPRTLSKAPKDSLVLFTETPAGQPDAIKTWVYPGESIGYEFVYPRDEALKIAKRSHSTVLSKSGNKIERIDENGKPTSDDTR